MKKIEQTGIIPIESIGTVFGNYLKFFKVYFVFYVIPLVSIGSAFYFTNKEKIMIVIQNLIQYCMVSAMAAGNMEILKPVEETCTKSIIDLFSTPSASAITLLGLVIFLICASCLHIGLKHTFYKQVSIIAILKEGFAKTLWFLWTIFTFQVSGWVVGLLFGLIMVLSIFLGPLMIVVYFVALISMMAFYSFYIPIHFFSANNPFSSLYYSFTTFWKNILSMIVYVILFSLVGIAFSAVIMIIVCMPIYMYLKGHNPDLPREMLRFQFFCYCIPVSFIVLPYTMMWWGWVNNLIIFIAYPELLNNEEEEKTITIESADIHVDNQNNMNTPAFLDENNNMGLSQQQKPSHQNDRPYLNERIGNTLFEKFTSRNVDTPKTPDTPQTPDTSNNTEPKGE